MYLVACPFTGDKTFEDLQPIFVTRVRKEMEIALTQGDRLVDFIRASSLLSFHYCECTCDVSGTLLILCAVVHVR